MDIRTTPSPTASTRTPSTSSSACESGARRPSSPTATWSFSREGFGGGRRVPPGAYRIVLTADGQEFTPTIRVEADPNLPPALAAEGAESAEENLTHTQEEQEDRIPAWIDD